MSPVRAGQDVTNVSFALVSARLGRISGRVTTSAGEPYAGGMLMVAPRNDEVIGMGFNMSGAQIRGDGTFQTGGLPPGNYTLIVQPRGGPMAAADGEVARMDVPVNGEDVAMCSSSRAEPASFAAGSSPTMGCRSAVQAGTDADIREGARSVAAHDGHAAERGP